MYIFLIKNGFSLLLRKKDLFIFLINIIPYNEIKIKYNKIILN